MQLRSVARKEKKHRQNLSVLGAGDEARTRYLHLGKVALYQMNYTRNSHGLLYSIISECQELFRKIFLFLG